MAQRIYSVMVRPGGAPDEALFVRDGFHFQAFVLTLIWALARRMWLVALLIAGALAAIGLVGTALRWSPAAILACQFVLALLVGLEAGAWRRATLERRGWVEAAVVVARSLDEAERRYFREMAPLLRP